MKTILFIEDEPVLQKTFEDLLGREGYPLISALDGEIGLRLIKLKKPDLVLLDLVLPKTDGFEVLKQMRGDPDTKNIPVIVLTNLGRVEDVEKALRMGASTYLIKTDYSLAEIIEKIKKLIKQ